MIVECIDDEFFIGVKKRVRARGKTPIKGELYEVVDTIEQVIMGQSRKFYILYEFNSNQYWHESFFREVDVNIEELKEVIENELAV